MFGINASRTGKEHCSRDARATLTTQAFTCLDERCPHRITSGHTGIVAHRCDHGIGWCAHSVACLKQLVEATFGHVGASYLNSSPNRIICRGYEFRPS
jgi:hypothetical protein